MFPYFGGKGGLVNLYPKPIHSLVIEPFCGSARYACKYFDQRDIWLNDASPIICSIWRWIKYATPGDVRQLPVLRHGDCLDNYKQLSQPERWLLGFCMRYGGECPSTKVTSTHIAPRDGQFIIRMKQDLLKMVGNIGHWKITNKSWKDMENVKGTWYVDPPYQGSMMGSRYPYGIKDINFKRLGRWCQEREGQVIVCEGTGADWLPFIPLTKPKYRRLRKDSYQELVWYKGCPKLGFEKMLESHDE